ncbi:MAG: hypothetical protein KDE56_20630 [Anaerolineales bacterium]|nr:hypothetical protein [Anaerolineales bacterium]
MKKLLIILFVFLAACSPQVAVEEPAATSQPADVNPDPLKAVAPETAVPGDDAYPVQPITDPLPADYPPAAEPALPGAYPVIDEAGFVWIIRPEGVQCETSSAPTGEKGLQNAVERLAAAGIDAQEWKLTEMMVTAVCGAPTSTHYLVQIPATELDKAIALGWTAQ